MLGRARRNAMHHRPMIASLHRPARFGIATVLALLGCGPVSTAGAAEPNRTPDQDVLCAWGRLSDGQGRLVRCLTRDEATRLREAAPAATAPTTPSAAPAPSAAPGPTSTPSEGREAPQTADSAAPSPPPSTPPAPEALPFDIEVTSVAPDTGALPDAQKSLSKARDRYASCVDKNGGLTADRASVDLRFLVQALGRAEGVSVKKHRGMSEAAAKCIANVVDRRYVGYPEEPAVGVTVVVTLTKKKR
jgi:hypothetical protein